MVGGNLNQASPTPLSIPRQVIPNMHRAASRQASSATQSSHSNVSSVGNKSTGLTAAFESTSLQKVEILRSQLDLDMKRFDLALKEQQESREDRALEREARQKDRELDWHHREREAEY